MSKNYNIRSKESYESLCDHLSQEMKLTRGIKDYIQIFGVKGFAHLAALDEAPARIDLRKFRD